MTEGTISKRRRWHAFPEIAALNAELTAVKKEDVQHCLEAVQLHKSTEIKARGGHDFLGVLLYEISA